MTRVLTDRNIITIYEPNLKVFKKIPIANISFIEKYDKEISFQLQNTSTFNIIYNDINETDDDFSECAQAIDKYYERKNRNEI